MGSYARSSTAQLTPVNIATALAEAVLAAAVEAVEAVSVGFVREVVQRAAHAGDFRNRAGRAGGGLHAQQILVAKCVGIHNVEQLAVGVEGEAAELNAGAG